MVPSLFGAGYRVGGGFQSGGAQACLQVAIFCKQTDNLRAIQILLGHREAQSTVRFLGFDIEDPFVFAEGMERAKHPREFEKHPKPHEKSITNKSFIVPGSAKFMPTIRSQNLLMEAYFLKTKQNII